MVRRESAGTFEETRLKTLLLKGRSCWEQENTRMKHLEDVQQGKWKIRSPTRQQREDTGCLFARNLECNEHFGWRDDFMNSGSLPSILHHFG